MATNQAGPNATRQPRQRHEGPNFMDGGVVSTLSSSVSENYTLCQLPDPCIVVRGHFKGSLPASGVSGQVTIKLGTSESDGTFGTFTVSGGAASGALAFYGPFTLSSSGGAFSASNPQFWPVVATLLTGLTSSTTSLSLYVMLEYVMPGNLEGSGSQGL